MSGMYRVGLVKANSTGGSTMIMERSATQRATSGSIAAGLVGPFRVASSGKKG